MASKKKLRSTQDEGTLNQVPQRVTRTFRTSATTRIPSNAHQPLDLTHPHHVAHYTCLSSKPVVAMNFYDEDLLA